MEISNNIIKIVRSLSQKKYRNIENCFVAEGTKCVSDTWNYFNCRWLIATKEWIDNSRIKVPEGKLVVAHKRQLERISQFSTASDVVAVYEIPDNDLNAENFKDELTLVLDGVQDPGNLGTIIRVCDWYGIKNIVCSRDTVDVYSHKVIQATMGAISRVKVFYADLSSFFEFNSDIPVYGTFLEGENIYQQELRNTGFIIMGNEGKGISDDVKNYVTHKLYIPSFPSDSVTSESLNVGIATAITLSEFKRRLL